MLTVPQILANRLLFEKLFRAQGWQWDQTALEKKFAKPRIRSFYLPVTQGKTPLFFKANVLGGQRIKRLLRKEARVTDWVAQKLLLAPPLEDQGEVGMVFWFARQYAQAENGFVCSDEQINQLTNVMVEQVADALAVLWKVSFNDLPDWRRTLVHCPENWSRPDIFFRKTLFYLKNLRSAKRQKSLDWDSETEKLVVNLLSVLRRKLGKPDPQQGCFVHGDLAPNNVYFSPDKIVLLDWEWSFWSVNELLGWSFDVANFYTRLWRNSPLAAAFLTQAVSLAKERFDQIELSLAAGMTFSVLQKLLPMWEEGIWQADHDRTHFNWLTGVLRSQLGPLVDKKM